MRDALLIPIIALAACQTAPKPAAPASQSWEELKRDRPDTFIASYNQALAADKQRLIQLGLEKDLNAIRAAVDFHLPPGDYTLQATGANATILRRQRVDNIAHLLVGLAYGASAVADAKRAKALVELAARIPSGEEKGDAAKLAPTVALVDFVEVVTGAPDPAGRRFSTVRYRVVEPLKNSPPAGTLIRMPGGPTHYADGTMGMSSGDMEMVKPGRYVLYLSRLKMSRIALQSQPVDLYARVFGPLREFGASFVPIGESSHPEVTLDDLRRAIRAQACSEGYVPVGNSAVSPQAC
ncbi:MAG: hypothetical protein LH485_01165 [Sphingomonas bacterium]|nr:hypothetical protein [Sphingomonas bacterium]